MTSKAYVLIKTKAQKTSYVLEEFRKYSQVKLADIVTGPHDLIVLLQAATADELLDFIIREIRRIDGVTDTTTCFVVPREGNSDHETKT